MWGLKAGVCGGFGSGQDILSYSLVISAKDVDTGGSEARGQKTSLHVCQ